TPDLQSRSVTRALRRSFAKDLSGPPRARLHRLNDGHLRHVHVTDSPWIRSKLRPNALRKALDLRYKPSAFDRAVVEEDRVQFIFGDYTLDTDTRELHRRDTLVSTQPQVFDLLTYLLQNRERVVSKDDLFAAVWAGRIVSDSTLGTHINAARRAIGDNGD